MFEEVCIGDVSSVITGKTPSTKNEEMWGPDIPFVTPKDLQAGKHIFKTNRHVTNTARLKYSRQVLPADSICVSCIGNLGYVGMTISPSLSNQQINSLVPNDSRDSDYLYYVMKWLWPVFKHMEGQSTTLSIINKTQFQQVRIPWPDLEARLAISAVMNSFDGLIECNLRINDYLAV